MNFRSGIFFLVYLVSFSLSAQHQLSQTKSERLFQKGSELIAHENYGAARNIFSEFLEVAPASDPRRSEAEYYVAFSALNLSHTDGEKLIDNFVANHPASAKASTAYFDLGNFFYDEKNYNKAALYYKKADFPALTSAQQSDGHFKWGYSLFNLKRLDDALEQFNFVKGQGGEYGPAASYYAGYVEYAKGDYANALADLKRAESNPGYAPVVPYLIASVYYRQKNYDELLRYASAAKDRKDLSNAGEFAMLLAEAYYFKGDYKNAADQYEKYLGANPAKADGPLLFRAGFANYSLNRVPKAVDYLSKSAAKKDSVSYYASYYLGIVNLKQGEKLLAINAFDHARKVPDDKSLAEEASFQFAKVSYDAGRTEAAITDFERYLKAYPSGQHANEVKELLAQAYVNGNNYHKAIEYIESLPSRTAYVDQAYQKATYLRGSELFNREEYQDAVAAFEKSLKYPKDPAYVALAAYWAGETYSVGRRFDQAIQHYQKVLTIPSADKEVVAKTRYGLGYAYYNEQQYDKALSNFREFIAATSRSNPNHVDALIRLADCYYVSKQYPQALENYNLARSAGSPDADYILLQSGMISGIRRSYADARNLFTSLVKSYPQSQYRDEALFQRAQFEIEQGNYSAAIEGLSQLIGEGRNSRFLPYAYIGRASSYYNLKEYNKTADDYRTVITTFPTHPVAQDALLPLQDALSLAGRSGEFENYLAEYKKANPENRNLEQIEYETAKNLYFDQQYQKALTKLEEFTKSYPESARVPEAQYYIAESFYRLKELPKALTVYDELSKDMNFNLGSKVIGRLAEIEFRLGQYDKAITHFHRLEKMATSKKEQYSAWSGLMESFFITNQYDSTINYGRLIIQHGAVNVSAQNKASLYIGKAAFAKGDFDTANDEFLNTVNAAQDEFGAEAKYMIGKILHLQKQYKPSNETLIGLTNDFASYELWVGKAFLLMADNFVAMENVFQARATLQSLVDDFPLEEIKLEARGKLAELDKAEAQKAAQDTIDSNR